MELVLMDDELIGRIDGVDPFYDDDADHIFSDADMRAFAATDGIEGKLLALALDRGQPLKRRFGAVEALFQGGWTGWRSGPEGGEVAAVMAEAIRADKIHNRWGLPGRYVGRSGRDLLSIGQGVEEALTPLLDDTTPLVIDGSEAATVNEQAGNRVKDLAAYLLEHVTPRG